MKLKEVLILYISIDVVVEPISLNIIVIANNTLKRVLINYYSPLIDQKINIRINTHVI